MMFRMMMTIMIIFTWCSSVRSFICSSNRSQRMLSSLSCPPRYSSSCKIKI